MARTQEIMKSVNLVVPKEGNWYLARAQGLRIFTEARSLKELRKNVKEAATFHLRDLLRPLRKLDNFENPSMVRIDPLEGEYAMSPRRYLNISGMDLLRRLERHFGYQIIRQRGSHIRARTGLGGEHSITVPDHDLVARGTLAGIIQDVAQHFGLDEDEILARLRQRR